MHLPDYVCAHRSKPSFLVCRSLLRAHPLVSYAHGLAGNDSIIMLHADDAVCDTTRAPINLGYGLQTYGQGCSTSVTVSLSLMPRPVHSDI